MLPKARVVYCSATGVTDVKNMVGVEKVLFYIIDNNVILTECQETACYC